MKKKETLPMLLHVSLLTPNLCECTIITHNMHSKDKDNNNIIVSTLYSNPDQGMLTDHLTNLIAREKLLEFKLEQGQELPVYVQFQRFDKTTFQQWLARENKEYKCTFYEFDYIRIRKTKVHNKIKEEVHSFIKTYNLQYVEKYEQNYTRIVVHPKILTLGNDLFNSQNFKGNLMLIYSWIQINK